MISFKNKLQELILKQHNKFAVLWDLMKAKACSKETDIEYKRLNEDIIKIKQDIEHLDKQIKIIEKYKKIQTDFE